ncbi:MAG TPA: hypothetical protein VHX14_19575, partial [Thermoanaerobaculia bacterium]|nr:hypothetical protein [Thermoanaerobaculia bacterium]
MHTLRDGEDLSGADRGDELPEGDKPITDDEKKVAEELKLKEKADEDAKAEKEKAEKEKKEAKDEDEEEDDDKRKDTRIPLKRHKEILEEERLKTAQALAKLAQFQGAEDIGKTNEELNKASQRLIGMEAEHAKLINDGNVAEAAKKMSEIRLLERDINDIRTDLKAAAAE